MEQSLGRVLPPRRAVQCQTGANAELATRSGGRTRDGIQRSRRRGREVRGRVRECRCVWACVWACVCGCVGVDDEVWVWVWVRVRVGASECAGRAGRRAGGEVGQVGMHHASTRHGQHSRSGKARWVTLGRAEVWAARTGRNARWPGPSWLCPPQLTRVGFWIKMSTSAPGQCC